MKMTNREIEDELEREIQQSAKKQQRRIRRAVNPQRGFGC
jgi:hypothetical protein